MLEFRADNLIVCLYQHYTYICGADRNISVKVIDQLIVLPQPLLHKCSIFGGDFAMISVVHS